MHHLGHLHRLGDDHAHQVLGRGDHHNAVNGEGLEHGEGHVAGSRGHVHKHIVYISPDHVAPELLDGTGDDGAPPDHRVGLVLGEQVEAHDADAGLGLGGIDAQLAALGPGVDAEGGGDGGAGDVGVQHGHLLAHAAHGHRQGGGHQALAHAALAADHGDDLSDVGQAVGGDVEVLGRSTLPAALTAGGAVVGTF